MKKVNIEPNLLIKIGELFAEKNWEIDDNEEATPSRYNKFCEMIAPLSDDQQELLITLASNFVEIDSTQYMKYLSQCIANIPPGPFKKGIAIAPLLAPEDLQKDKSSTALMYFCKNTSIRFHSRFHGSHAYIYSRVEELIENTRFPLNTRNLPTVILFDDFIGTGNTAMSAIEYLTKNSFLKKEDIIVLSFVSQKSGLQNLRSAEINTYCIKTINKGITDFYPENQIKDKINLMLEIERKIKVKEDYTLGYGRSEALITLVRTPNNTFPVFWLQSKRNTAPFQR